MVKRTADEAVARFRARLVARGFTQRKDVDLSEMFCPTVGFDVLAAAALQSCGAR